MLADGLAERLSGRLARGRAAANARMLSRVTIKRDTGTTSKDADGFDVPAWDTVHTNLRFRLAGANQGGAGTRTVTRGGAEIQVAVRVGCVPVDTTDLRDGDVIEITEGEQAGTFVQIIETAGQDQATELRLPVFEVQQPEGWTT